MEMALTEQQREKLVKQKSKLAHAMEELKGVLGKCGKVEEYIPKPTRASAATALANAQIVVTEVDLALGNSWLGKASVVQSSAQATKVELQEISRKLLVY